MRVAPPVTLDSSQRETLQQWASLKHSVAVIESETRYAKPMPTQNNLVTGPAKTLDHDQPVVAPNRKRSARRFGTRHSPSRPSSARNQRTFR